LKILVVEWKSESGMIVVGLFSKVASETRGPEKIALFEKTHLDEQ